MKPTRLAILVIAVSTLLAAEPICRHLVFRAVHKHHSKATVAKWTAYNAALGIKPKGKEILAELDITCEELKLQTVDQVGFILPTDEPQWTEAEVSIPVDSPAPVAPDFYLPAGNTEPNLVSSQVPEPSSLFLLGTGFFGLAFITIQRKKQSTNGL